MATSSAYEPIHQATTEKHQLQATNPTERPWQPGKLRQLPWTGLLALTLGFGCGVAALTIALVSDGKPLDYWDVYNYSLQPTVLLAILVTFANALLGYAFASGITIFWWSSALAGSALRKLHASQSRGDSLISLLTLRPVFNAVTIASVFTILLSMDQPLFQRGIRTVTRHSTDTRNMSIPISSSPIQVGATGVSQNIFAVLEGPETFHPLFAQVVRQYQNREPIRLALPECKGRCDFEVISTGWEVDCAERQTPYRLMSSVDFALWMNRNVSEYKGPLKTQSTFSVNVTMLEGTDEIGPFHINTSVMYKATAGRNGTMRWRSCNFTEALIKYPVEISNNTLKLQSLSPGTNRTVHRILRELELGGPGGGIPSTLGGIWSAMKYQFASHANITFDGYDGEYSALRTPDMASNTYLQPAFNDTQDGYIYSVVDSEFLDDYVYSRVWSDPTDDMINMAHELTLHAAITTTDTLVITRWNQPDLETTPNLLTQGQPEIGSPNLTFVNRTISQDADVTMTFEEAVYEVQPQWLAGAFALIVIACLSILPTYWGWWHLGRPVSMSFLEIAKAFDAPLMHRANPNGTFEDHLRSVGDTCVRYGSHATTVQELESDTTEQLTHRPKFDHPLDDLNNTVGGQDSSNDVGPNRPPPEDGTSSDMSIVGSTTPDDGIELHMLHFEASSASRMLSDLGTTGDISLSSDPSESSPETQVDSPGGRALGTGPATSRIHTRIEMRLKFAEE